MEPIVNRVAQSEIDVFDLESFFEGLDVREFDLAPLLYRGLILREKDFRASVREMDWAPYSGSLVHIVCSADTIIPPWSYMLVASRLEGIASMVVVGDRTSALQSFLTRAIERFDWSIYQDRIVVVKGCGAHNVPESAYAMVASPLQQVAKKLMYGEPCSSVPIWRRPKKTSI